MPQPRWEQKQLHQYLLDFLLQHKERGFNDLSYNDHDYDVCGDPNDAD
jgi:hypothetical protein